MLGIIGAGEAIAGFPCRSAAAEPEEAFAIRRIRRSIEEIVAVMRTVGDSKEGVRLRALVVILWRSGLRISEALALAESDLDPARGAVLVAGR